MLTGVISTIFLVGSLLGDLNNLRRPFAADSMRATIISGGCGVGNDRARSGVSMRHSFRATAPAVRAHIPRRMVCASKPFGLYWNTYYSFRTRVVVYTWSATACDFRHYRIGGYVYTCAVLKEQFAEPGHAAGVK